MVSCSGFGLPLHAQLLRLFVTRPEQETIKGTHAQETSAYQRRPTTQHAAQGSNPPIRALYMLQRDVMVVLLQRDAIVGHAEAIRTQSRKPSKAHTHKKHQPGAIHAASEDNTHTSHHTACHQCSKRRPARHPPRAQQVPPKGTHN